MRQRLATAIDSNRLLVLGAVMALPLVAGFILPASLIDDGMSLCILREYTGIPCPFCGATRAFISFGHAQGDWLSFNGYWVLLSLTALLGLAALLATRFVSSRPSDFLAGQYERAMRSSLGATALIAIVVAPGWIWALVNSQNLS